MENDAAVKRGEESWRALTQDLYSPNVFTQRRASEYLGKLMCHDQPVVRQFAVQTALDMLRTIPPTQLGMDLTNPDMLFKAMMGPKRNVVEVGRLAAADAFVAAAGEGADLSNEIQILAKQLKDEQASKLDNWVAPQLAEAIALSMLNEKNRAAAAGPIKDALHADTHRDSSHIRSSAIGALVGIMTAICISVETTPVFNKETRDAAADIAIEGLSSPDAEVRKTAATGLASTLKYGTTVDLAKVRAKLDEFKKTAKKKRAAWDEANEHYKSIHKAVVTHATTKLGGDGVMLEGSFKAPKAVPGGQARKPALRVVS